MIRNDIMKTFLTVKGTHCESCKVLIEDVLKDIGGVASATVDFKTGKTEIEHSKKLDMENIRKEIESLGDYSVVG